VNETPTPVVSAKSIGGGSGDEGLEAQFEALAGLLAAACSARGCILEWRGHKEGGTICKCASETWGSALRLTRDFISRDDSPTESFIPSLELRTLLRSHAGLAGPASQAFAVRRRTTTFELTLVCVVPADISQEVACSIVRLAAAAAVAIATRREESASRNFWRQRAAESSERIARLASERRREENERKRLDSAIATISKLRPRNRISGLGSALARLGPFDAWLITEITDGTAHVVAASPMLLPHPSFGPDSPVILCASRDELLVSSRQKGSNDKLLADFEAYLCVPLGDSVAVLASRNEIDPAMIARTETMAVRLRPILAGWRQEAENERLRALVDNLALRMFAAVDSERARIARDLHDHQAQVLTAARLALQAGPEEARGIFKQLEDALRLRVRELRPPMLGRSNLADALRYELKRLADHGIKGRLVHAARMKTLTRPIQQLCYQAAREALTNVARHSGATRVEIRLERRAGKIRLTIRDNGKGMESLATGGSGLAGISERLELMGGRLKLESRPGATCVVAEVPDLR
jgi:signal transduction histidine kinase